MHFHIVKRDSCPFWKKLCLYLAAVAAALVLGGLLLLVMGAVSYTHLTLPTKLEV